MTEVQLTIVAFSVLGGLLLVAAGFLFARSGVFPRLVPRGLKEGIKDNSLGAQLASVKEELEAASQESEARAADLAVLQQELDKHKERLSEAEKRIAGMEPLEDELYLRHKQDLSLKSTIENLREENLDAERNRAELAARMKEKDDAITLLQQDRDGLIERFAEFEKRMHELAETVHEREAENRGLLVELERLTPQLCELERCRERVGLLELSLEEMDALRKLVSDLHIENARLHSLELVQGTAPRVPFSPTSGQLGQSLNRLIEEIGRREGARGAVVADENGFLAAGVGDHTDALGAIAAIYDEIAEKVPDMLPVSRLPRIDIVDENGVTIAIQPILIDTGRLLLVSLSVGPGPERDVADRIFREST